MGSRHEALGALVVWMLMLSSSLGQETKYWQWEAKKPFHNAIVYVRVGYAGGAGTIFSSDEKNCWIITAWHTFEAGGNSAPQMSWDGASWYTGRLQSKDVENDIAIIWQPTLTKAYAAPMAKEPVKAGETLSFAGFGGPGNQMRRWTAVARTETSDDVIQGNTSGLNGDSGGGVFNANGELVGVISGGSNLQSFGLVTEGDDWQLHYPLRCCAVRPMRGLLGWRMGGQRIRIGRGSPQQCPPGGCRPQGYIMPQSAPQSFPQYAPPTVPDETPAPLPDSTPTPTDLPTTPTTPTNPPTPPITPTTNQTDIDELNKKIEDLNVKIDAIKPLKGDKGDKGDTGEKGPKGDNGAAATIDLAALTTKLVEHLKTDPSFVQSCKGEKGDIGNTAPVDIQALAVEIASKLKSDPAFLKSVKGLKGDTGEKGPKGDTGGIGSDADVDVDALAALVTKKLPDIQVLFLGKDDVQHSVQYVKLGGILKIPPVILSKRENGKTFMQVKALGDKINLELVPVE